MSIFSALLLTGGARGETRPLGAWADAGRLEVAATQFFAREGPSFAPADETRELERMNSLDRAVHAAALERFDAAVRDLPPADEDRLPYYLHMHKAGGGVPEFRAFLALVTSRGRRAMTSGPISS